MPAAQLLPWDAPHFLEERLGHEDAGHGSVHVVGHAHGREDHDSGHDLDVGAGGDLASPLHEPLEVVDVVDGLGLEEFVAGLDLLGELEHLRLERVGFRRHHGAGEEVGGAVQLVARPSRGPRSSSHGLDNCTLSKSKTGLA